MLFSCKCKKSHDRRLTGTCNLNGNKIIFPSEIDMDQKLITNLDTNLNQDLSAVNMITLKNKVEPKADKN